ncbi:Oxygen-dependent choline dehydrogenase [Hyphodiscus hymeniophilus]|uniref:Oxygen-dependent choline dehydrogenase n=1 Tax=Hyphodiscus hymeniophilus TaxID=353542 RepID=A0A9P6VNY2_9HELO|nr:Oxygen-dependent choline dehydrogenase [Hyphodiscus hymeniophilus]
MFRFFSVLALTACLSAATSTANDHQPDKVTLLNDYDYIVVGSGAGGGPLAARLAIAGSSVLLLEAGADEGENVDVSTPAFYSAASEDSSLSWNFYVRHYKDNAQEARNSKATGSELLGIWYPRTGTLGGCTMHNALITVYPHEEDWTNIQKLTGDASWAPEKMRKYFERLEDNHYLSRDGPESAGHGFDGWLGTQVINRVLTAQDPKILAILTAADATLANHASPPITNARELEELYPVDVNTDVPHRDSTNGIYRPPMSTTDSKRSSPRDFLVATANAVNKDGSKKYKLDIRLHAFATKVKFQHQYGEPPRAMGVDFLDGQSLYRADSRSNTTGPGRAGSVNARREVIIAGGTFNTPQILKLSGIGPKNELLAHGIPVVVDLPGVGQNLQDHYEISTVVQFDDNFDLVENCTFLTPNTKDKCFEQYTSGHTELEKGFYATNLIQATILRKSKVAGNERDTFHFGGPGNFRGYFHGYTASIVEDAKHFFWATLKAHEKNNAGSVLLKSSDPLDVPQINIAYFESGTTTDNAVYLDMEPLVEGIQFSRRIYGNISSKPANEFVEVYPGANVSTVGELETFVRDEAWGHHATGTARIGADNDPNAVLDSRLRVRGVTGLRVVDASVFPEIPGFFPVVSVYMVSEKAADMIIQDNECF